MTDVLGYRLKVGMLVPSTNSSVQPEMDDMRPPGVTNHVSRIDVPNQTFHSDDDAEAIVEATWGDLMPAMDRLMACNPDRVIMAMAVPCFWGGVEATNALRERMQERAGVPVLLPPDALHSALQAIGRTRAVHRIGIVSPYMPLADRHVQAWFEETGYEVAGVEGLQAVAEDQVVAVDADAQLAALRRLNEKNADVLIQVGTSMASARLVAGAEAWLGKPVISVNVACYWACLRAAGINDVLEGVGCLGQEL